MPLDSCRENYGTSCTVKSRFTYTGSYRSSFNSNSYNSSKSNNPSPTMARSLLLLSGLGLLLLLASLPAPCSSYRRGMEMGKVIELDEENWRVVLEGEWMILL